MAQVTGLRKRKQEKKVRIAAQARHEVVLIDGGRIHLKPAALNYGK